MCSRTVRSGKIIQVNFALTPVGRVVGAVGIEVGRRVGLLVGLEVETAWV